MKRKIAIEDTEKIIGLYKENNTIIQIAKKMGCETYTLSVRKILIDNGFNLKSRIGSNSRTKKVDENFFEVINTPDKAYILGWIMSDGYVNKYKLTFCIKDLEILEKIKSLMKSEHKISHAFTYDKRTKKTYERYSLQINSKTLVNSLKKLGIYQAKSFTVGLPKISKHLYPHLIRGIFDGDGFIGNTSGKPGNKHPRFSMIVSEKLYNALDPIFEKEGIFFKKPCLVAENNGNKILKINIYKREQLQLFFNYIYGDICEGVTKLERKFNKFKKVF